MKIIGHRGAKGLAPENTLQSIVKALEVGVDAVEFDVHLTRDGAMPLHHDDSVSTLSGPSLALRDLSFAELKRLAPDITTLEEALETIAGKAEACVEIKRGVDPDTICEKLVAYQKRGHAVSVLSFDYKLLQKVRKNFPELTIVINERWSGVRVAWRARVLKTKRIQMNQSWLWSGFVRHMHKRGFQLAPYTVNNPERTASWAPFLYGVVTDRPDLFKR